MLSQRTVMFFFALICSSSMLFADEIVLINGDKIQGNIVKTEDGKVVLQHAILGTLNLSQAQIQSITKQGEEKLKEKTQAKAVVKAVVKAVKPTAREIEAANQNATWFSNFKKDWDSKFEAGAALKTGNSEQSNIYLRFKTTTKNDKRQWDYDAAYYRDQTDGEISTNEFTTGLQHEWFLLNSPWSLFLQGRYDYDDFESWDYRVTSAFGAGYQWIKTDKWNVKLHAGGGAAKEFGSENDNVRPELLVGFNLSCKITDNQAFAAATTFFPDLSDIKQYRVLSTAQWVLSLSKEDKIDLKIGVENEYQSEVDDDVKNNDFRLFSALVFGF